MTARDDLAAKLVALENQMAAAEKRAVEFEAKLAGIAEAAKPPKPVAREPYQPIDYTSGASMDRETMRDLASAIPDTLARDLRADLARGNPVTQSVAQLTPDRGASERGTGWAKPNPISPPSGVDHCDRIMDMADAQDRADLERRLARSVKKE